MKYATFTIVQVRYNVKTGEDRENETQRKQRAQVQGQVQVAVAPASSKRRKHNPTFKRRDTLLYTLSF
jgi:hypothetical protein